MWVSATDDYCPKCKRKVLFLIDDDGMILEEKCPNSCFDDVLKTPVHHVTGWVHGDAYDNR